MYHFCYLPEINNWPENDSVAEKSIPLTEVMCYNILKNIRRGIHMKKVLCILIALVFMLTCTVFAEGIRVGALKGPTTMGMVKQLSDGGDAYEFTLAGAADELTPLFLKGELDILAVPANLAAVLYNKTEGNVRFLAVNTLGVLYIVEKGGETVQSIADLKGRTLYATGKGTTPEYTLRFILSENGLDADQDVTIEWKSEPAEVIAAMNEDASAVAMMPQPYVTVARGQVEGLKVALDLTEEWKKVDPEHTLITAGIITSKDYLEAHAEEVDTFLAAFADSVAYVNAEPAEAAVLCEEYGIVKAAVAEKAIPACNLVCITGEDAKTIAANYLNVLCDQAPASVGGAVPGEDFYYVP